MKRCSACGEPKSLDDFPRDKSRASGRNPACKECRRASDRRYYDAHRAAIMARVKTWQDNHPDRVREIKRLSQRKRLAQPEYRAEQIASTRRWRAANPEKVRAYNVAYYRAKLPLNRARYRSWYNANPDRVVERTYLARAVRRQRLANVQTERIPPQALAARDGWRCHICGGTVEPSEVSVDHLLPVAAGGSHTWSNVALSHLLCNIRRGNGRIPAQLRLNI